MRNNKLATTSGGGFLIIFGSLFYFPLVDICIRYSSGELRSPWEFVGGLLFAAVATGLVFGRSGTELNLDKRVLNKWWGLTFWRISQQTTELDAVSEVRLVKEERGSGDSSYTAYVVYLASADSKVEWKAPGDYLVSRRESEQLSTHLQLPIQDDHTGHRRMPHELDLPLGKRLRAAGEAIKLTTQPMNSKIVQRSEDSTEIFEVPVRVPWLNLVVWLGFLIWVGTLEMPSGVEKLFEPLSLKLILSGIGVVTVLQYVRRYLRGRLLVIVSPEGLQQEEKGKLRSRTLIPLSELEELDVVDDGRAWEARSDNSIIRFESRLRADEVYWMRDTLEHYIYKFTNRVAI